MVDVGEEALEGLVLALCLALDLRSGAERVNLMSKMAGRINSGKGVCVGKRERGRERERGGWRIDTCR